MMKQLVLSLLAALISLPASADAYFFYTYEGQTLTYITSDDNCHVVNCNMHETTSPNVIIPEAVYSKENQRSYTVTEIQNSAFSLSTGITSVTIPATVQTIKNNAFYNCSLSSVSLPKAKTIRSHAFYNCTNLKTITFNGPIDDLQRDAFSLCPAIERIIFTSATPFSASVDIFPASNPYDEEEALSPIYENATLYIPEGSEEAFAAVSPWNLFKKVETFKPETNVNMTLSHSEIEINKDDTAQLTINLEGKRIGTGFITVKYNDESGLQSSEICRIEVKDKTNLINEIQAQSDDEIGDIYTIDGILVKKAPTLDDVRALAPGLYVIGSRKIFVR